MERDFSLGGLTELQKDLLVVAKKKLPKEQKKIMRKVGNKARRYVVKKAKASVKKKTGNYHKGFKRGKVFDGDGGETVVRVFNSAPHAHLIEYGHEQIVNDQSVGFTPGKHVMEKGIREFDDSGDYENMLSDWIDDMLRSSKL